MSIRDVRLLPRGDELWVLGTGMEGEACLKARLPATAEHPRAAIELLDVNGSPKPRDLGA